jgi:putative membrane protein
VMQGWHGSWGTGGWLLMAVAMVVFWGAVAWLVVTLLHRTGSTTGPAAPDMPRVEPLRLLDERYARGEIDEEEYLLRRNVLRWTS